VDVPKLGIMFPSAEGEQTLIRFPLVLPMGVIQSPPLFTVTAETLSDLANHQLGASVPRTLSRLDAVSETPPLLHPLLPRSPPLCHYLLRQHPSGALPHLSSARISMLMTLWKWLKGIDTICNISSGSSYVPWAVTSKSKMPRMVPITRSQYRSRRCLNETHIGIIGRPSLGGSSTPSR
jgi:hypothetical protein